MAILPLVLLLYKSMLKIKPKTSQDEWVRRFTAASHGHILWDGNAKDPTNPIHAYTSSHHFVDNAFKMNCFQEGDRILDLGCGNGRLEIALSEYPVEVVGLDPVRECIEFSQKAFEDFPQIQFKFIDIWNEVFNTNGTIKPEEFVLDYPDNHFDFTICYSVFTHLQTVPVATKYMEEIKRTLRPGGRFFSTWYRSPPDKEADSYVGRTVYREWEIMTLLRGFSFDYTYGGHTGAYYDQWGIYATLMPNS
jgi:SAM-dependent methyltransferase